MINKENLVEGSHYFLVWYFDEKKEVPDIETHVYVGKNVFSTVTPEQDFWYFQDPESYTTLGDFTNIEDKNKCKLLKADSDTLDAMYDIDGLIVELEKLRS